MSIVEERLRIVPEFRTDEEDHLRQLMTSKLERRLSRFDAEQVELELSMKGRDTAEQRTVLEAWISGLPRFVATSNELDRDKAVKEVRDDLHRQIDKHVTKQESARRR